MEQLVLKSERKVLVHGSEDCNKVDLKSADGTFRIVGSVVLWRDELDCDALLLKETLQYSTPFT
jgi:hypothetical protein